MELSEIIPHIEALIFASDRPLTSLELVDLINNAFGFMEQQITLDQTESALEGICEKYNSDFYPFEVIQSGGGWQFLSKAAFHTTIAQLNGGKFLKKLSNAALETLSIIAYKQPITKGEIESIRGVNSDYSVQKLLEKELVIISGRNEELPGKPLIYETSKSFMDYFGLNSVEDLPKIKEVLAEQIEPTLQQRNTEENADFGIFDKLGTPNVSAADFVPVAAEATSVAGGTDDPTTDTINNEPTSMSSSDNNDQEITGPNQQDDGIELAVKDGEALEEDQANSPVKGDTEENTEKDSFQTEAPGEEKENEEPQDDEGMDNDLPADPDTNQDSDADTESESEPGDTTSYPSN